MFRKSYKIIILLVLISAFSIFAMPTFAESVFVEEEPISVTIDYQIDYSEWYQIAADSIGVDVSELTDSTDSIKDVAKANDVATRDVIKAIFAPEKAALRQLRQDGQITKDVYRARVSEAKDAVRAFVRTASPDPYTVPTVQEARWSELGLDTYTYTLRTLCYCFGVLEHTITVVDNEVVNVTGFDPNIFSITLNPDGTFTETEGAVVDVDPAGFRTMDEWFTYITDQQARLPYYLSAQFDDTLGYPTSTYVDSDPRSADEEIGYAITLIQE